MRLSEPEQPPIGEILLTPLVVVRCVLTGGDSVMGVTYKSKGVSPTYVLGRVFVRG